MLFGMNHEQMQKLEEARGLLLKAYEILEVQRDELNRGTLDLNSIEEVIRHLDQEKHAQIQIAQMQLEGD